jgi:hypothetical protein
MKFEGCGKSVSGSGGGKGKGNVTKVSNHERGVRIETYP